MQRFVHGGQLSIFADLRPALPRMIGAASLPAPRRRLAAPIASEAHA